MKAFLGAVVALIVVIGGAVVVLNSYQRTVDEAFVGYGARPDIEGALRGGPRG